MGSQCTFDKKARLRQIKQDIDGLQAKSKQSSSHVPAGMTYAEVFSAAINAAMRHKRAMVGNLSRKSDDSPAEMTFEEIQAYERVTDDYVRPSAISLPPQPGLAKSTSARFQAPLNRESGLGAGREGAEGRSHMRRQGSFAPSVFMSDAYPSSASGRGTPSAALGRLARQSSTNLSGRASATVPELHQSFRRSSTNISSRGSHGPDAAPDRASSTHKPKPQEGDAPTSKQRGGSAGGFVKPTLSPAVINYGFQAVEQQQPQQESVHKERDGGLCSTSTAGKFWVWQVCAWLGLAGDPPSKMVALVTSG
uniref:Uncharacterized protein n=1 Tax=Dunaliella tertiolecta TaxID=3047 RepID=A0A7S3QU35_DUNTE